MFVQTVLFYSILIYLNLNIQDHVTCAPIQNVTLTATNSTDVGGPIETQQAACSITAGDLQASAQATLTHTLEGVCGAKDMLHAFATLEMRLITELSAIRTVLGIGLIEQEHLQKPYSGHYYHTNKIATRSRLHKHATRHILSTIQPSWKNDDARSLEILHLNMTLTDRAFTYYWRIKEELLNDGGRIQEIQSPVFYVSGKHLQMRAIPHHLSADYLYLQIKMLNETRHQNGLRYTFSYRISILDQGNKPNGSRKDMSSQLLESGLGYRTAMNVLRSRGYIVPDIGLLVKLTVYL